MWWHSWFTLGLIGLIFFGLIRNYAADALLVGAVVLCGLVGIIEPREVFAGFSNTGVLTVAALYIVAAGLRETGALDMLGNRLLGAAKGERGVMGRMAITVTGLSSFLNNTPIVAMFMPILNAWCKKRQVSPSRLLMPLSFLSILGGMCTLIGTSTNLVVNGLMVERFKQDPELFGNLHSMSLFELSWVGVPCAVGGAAYLVFLSHRLLPDRRGFMEQLGDTVREYLVNMQVQAGCRLIGQSVQAAGLRQLPGLFLTEVVRGGEIISPVSPDQTLQAGDVVTFTGSVETIVDLEKIPGFVPVADEGYESGLARRRHAMLCEAVVSNTSPLIGKTIRDNDFRALYNAAVVAVHRGGERLKGRVGDIVVRNGDTLLLQAGPHFARAHRNNTDFILVSSVAESRAVRHDKAVLSLVLLAGLVALMATRAVPIVLAAFFVAGLMVATRCISVTDARQSVDFQTIITICAAFGLGKALVNSGCVASISALVVGVLGIFGPVVVLAAVFVLTSMFTMLVTNNAAAALMFPFAIAIAVQLDVNPRPFAVAVALGASTCFMSPIGYQTNLMVYAPGGYRFSDFARVGLPLNFIILVLATLLVPLVWPL